MSHPADAADFFLNKTKNTDLPQAEGGLSSFGKNCKKGRPLKMVLLHTAKQQTGSKTDTFLSSLHLLYLTLSTWLWLLWRETQKTGAVPFLHQHPRGCRSARWMHVAAAPNVHCCSPCSFWISVLCSLFPFFSCLCPSAITEVVILQCWQSGPCCSLAYNIEVPQFYYLSVWMELYFTF